MRYVGFGTFVVGVSLGLLVVSFFDISSFVSRFLLPVFERMLIFHAPPAIFVRSTTITVYWINMFVELSKYIAGISEISADPPRIYIVGSGIKSGCFLSTKLAMEIGLHHKKRLVLDDFVHTFYKDPWSLSGNFEFAKPPPAPTVLTTRHIDTIVHNGCQATQRIIVGDDIRDNVEVRCVWFHRDPLDRLVSFYTYTLDAGEYQLRNASAYVNNLPYKDGVKWVFRTFARNVIEAQDNEFLNFFDQHYNCTQVWMSDMKSDFDDSVRRMLAALDLEEEAGTSGYEALWLRLRTHDLRRHSGTHPHASRASKALKKLVQMAVEEDEEMSAFVTKSRVLFSNKLTEG